jgi:hypothetical protein
MKCSRASSRLAVSFVLLLVPATARFTTHGPGERLVAQEMPQPPKPGPEHEVFKMDEGTWDATVEMAAAPGAAPMTSKGVETNTRGCGGLCLITDFKGEFMPGQPFHGHGVGVYDAAKKKYVGSWTDSMSRGLMVSESTFDPATKTFTGSSEAPDPTGKMMKFKSTVEYKDENTRVFTMYTPTPDGKEVPGFKITYVRRK